MELEQALTRVCDLARRLGRELVIESVDPHEWSIEFTLVGWRTFYWSCCITLDEVIEGDITEMTPASLWCDGLLNGLKRNDVGELV